MEHILFKTFIDPYQWDSAGWRGVAFLHDPDGVEPPCLGIVFDDMESGRQIFSNWIERLGRVDEFEELRITIIEGVILGEPAGYTVHLSSEPAHCADRAKSLGTQLDYKLEPLISRHQRMVPAPGSPHLARFQEEFRRHGQYSVLPVSVDLIPDFELAIKKAEIFQRQVSDIGCFDVDDVVLSKYHVGGSRTVH